jgi:hypothetical protein
VSDADFKARIGQIPVSKMTIAEKVETVNRIGLPGFRDLISGRGDGRWVARSMT